MSHSVLCFYSFKKDIRKEFRRHPQSQVISRGSELALTCLPPRGKPKPKVRWLKNDRDVGADGKRILTGSNKLIIKNFEKGDEGSYRCEATNVAGRKLSNPAVIKSTGQCYITKKYKRFFLIDISLYQQS